MCITRVKNCEKQQIVLLFPSVGDDTPGFTGTHVIPQPSPQHPGSCVISHTEAEAELGEALCSNQQRPHLDALKHLFSIAWWMFLSAQNYSLCRVWADDKLGFLSIDQPGHNVPEKIKLVCQDVFFMRFHIIALRSIKICSAFLQAEKSIHHDPIPAQILLETKILLWFYGTCLCTDSLYHTGWWSSKLRTWQLAFVLVCLK